MAADGNRQGNHIASLSVAIWDVPWMATVLDTIQVCVDGQRLSKGMDTYILGCSIYIRTVAPMQTLPLYKISTCSIHLDIDTILNFRAIGFKQVSSSLLWTLVLGLEPVKEAGS